MADARLVTHFLFSDADTDAVNRALDQITVRKREIADGEVFLSQGESYTSLALLIGGSLRATIEDMSGRSLLIEILTAPDALAIPVLYSSEPRIPVTLTAVGGATVCCIPRDHLDRLCVRFPSIHRRLLEDAGDKFVFISTKLRLVQFASLRKKVAGYLLSLMREQHSLVAHDRAAAPRGGVGDDTDAGRRSGERRGTGPAGPAEDKPAIRIPYSRERLSELFGVARPSLSRTLGEMAREGLFEIQGSTCIITDVAGLRAELSS